MTEPSRGAIGPAGCAALFVVLAAATWRSLGDPVVDLGTDLYLAWRVAEGDALYRDLAYRNGPLSPHLNGLWFSLFGVSLRTLMLANLAVLAGTVALVHRLLARAAGAWGAAVAVAIFLVAFAFAHGVEVGTYSWVLPYQHAQTHGVALGFAMLAAFAVLLRRASCGASAVAGLALGLAFLTKAELFVPAAATFAAGTAALALGSGGRAVARHLAWALPVAALPPLAFGVGLAHEIGASDALRGVLGNWVYLGAGIADDPFYRRGLGLDDPAGNAARAAAAALVLAALAAAGAGLDRWAGARVGRVAAGVVFVATALCFAFVPRAGWVVVARGLPLVTAGLAAGFATAAWRARPARGAAAGEGFVRAATLAVWAVFALALLGKMILNARIEHYGFSLAAPATLLAVAAWVGILPERMRARGTSGRVARAVACGTLAAFVASSALATHHWVSARTFRLAEGADALWVDPQRGRPLADAMERLEANTTRASTLLVVPEGASLNYWLRRRGPGRHFLFLPTELDAWGPDRVLAELRDAPPDVVMIVARSYREFEGLHPPDDPRYGREILRELVRTTERVGGTSEEAVARGDLRVEIRLRSIRGRAR